MTERAGRGPQGAWDAIKAGMPKAQLSGIVGDKAHTYGYHRGRNFVSSGDYSATQADDRAGPGEAACGLDVTLSTADMKTVTNRLISATNNNDPRLRCLREFYGTTNGSAVTGRDVRTKNWITSDDSHLWHVHLSFYRKWADDPTECAKVAAVFTGKAGGGVTPTPEESDVPKQLVLSSVKPLSLKAGKWGTLSYSKWTPKDGSSGTSAKVSGKFYVATLDVTIDKLPLDGDVYVRYQLVSAKSPYPQKAVSAVSEIRGTTGATGVSVTRAAYCPKDQYLRALVSATHDCKVTAATWSVLYW